MRIYFLALSVILSGAALAAQTAPATWRIQDAPAEIRPIISRADLVIAAMQDSVLRELSRELVQGGPELAINSCHIDAATMTQRIGRSEGVAAGRTSDRLRNPTNAPKAWAADFVKAHAGKRARDVDGFVVDLGDKIGVMRPIVTRPMCVGCHGPVDRLNAGVRDVLANRYPADRAVGFKEGEIRGWFWVELPKPVR